MRNVCYNEVCSQNRWLLAIFFESAEYTCWKLYALRDYIANTSRTLRHMANVLLDITCGSERDILTCRTLLQISKKFWEELVSYVLWYDTEGTEKMHQRIHLLFHVFITSVTFSTSRCLPTTVECIYRHRLVGGIYDGRFWDGLRCHDTHTKFHKDWLRHSEVDTQAHRQHGECISLVLFFQNKKSRLMWIEVHQVQ
jgi:hypothetical protein